MIAAVALSTSLFMCAYPSTTDGDTFRCASGPKVRLWGVNAAELRHPGGQEAKRALTRIISGHVLACERRGNSYDRVVARCYLPDGRDVGRIMVDQGQAVDWPKYSKGLYGR